MSNRTSMSGSYQAIEVTAENKLGLIGRQRVFHERHWIRLAERKRRVAAQEQMLDRHHLGDITKNRRLETDRVEIEPAQIIADRHFQRAGQLRIGIDLALHAGTQD